MRYLRPFGYLRNSLLHLFTAYIKCLYMWLMCLKYFYVLISAYNFRYLIAKIFAVTQTHFWRPMYKMSKPVFPMSKTYAI